MNRRGCSALPLFFAVSAVGIGLNLLPLYAPHAEARPRRTGPAETRVSTGSARS